jgi:hypothetical protein
VLAPPAAAQARAAEARGDSALYACLHMPPELGAATLAQLKRPHGLSQQVWDATLAAPLPRTSVFERMGPADAPAPLEPLPLLLREPIPHVLPKPLPPPPTWPEAAPHPLPARYPINPENNALFADAYAMGAAKDNEQCSRAHDRQHEQLVDEMLRYNAENHTKALAQYVVQTNARTNQLVSELQVNRYTKAQVDAMRARVPRNP